MVSTSVTFACVVIEFSADVILECAAARSFRIPTLETRGRGKNSAVGLYCL